MRRSRNRLSAEDRKGLALFVAGIAILAALAAVVLQRVYSPENNYDRQTLCNEQLPREAHNLFIIDVSDAMSAHQKNFLNRYISRLLEMSEINDRFTIFVLDERYSGLSEPVVDLCRPRSAEDVSSLTSNRLFVESLYEDRFETPLESAIAAAVSAGDQPISPIYEALSDVAALRRIDPRAEEVNLTLVSDMIQNSRAGSVFSSGPSAIEQLPMIDLGRARTRVLWLSREKYKQYQTPELETSWEEYLASVSRFDQIERVRN